MNRNNYFNVFQFILEYILCGINGFMIVSMVDTYEEVLTMRISRRVSACSDMTRKKLNETPMAIAWRKVYPVPSKIKIHLFVSPFSCNFSLQCNSTLSLS